MKKVVYFFIESVLLVFLLTLLSTIYNVLFAFINSTGPFHEYLMLYLVSSVIHIGTLFFILKKRAKIAEVLRKNLIGNLIKILISLVVIFYVNFYIYVCACGPAHDNFPYKQEFNNSHWYFINRTAKLLPWFNIGKAYITKTLSIPEGYVFLPVPFNSTLNTYNQIIAPQYYALAVFLSFNLSVVIVYIFGNLEKRVLRKSAKR